MNLTQLKREIARIERCGFDPETTEIRLWDKSADGGEFFDIVDVVEDDSTDTLVVELHFDVSEALTVEDL